MNDILIYAFLDGVGNDVFLNNVILLALVGNVKRVSISALTWFLYHRQTILVDNLFVNLFLRRCF